MWPMALIDSCKDFILLSHKIKIQLYLEASYKVNTNIDCINNLTKIKIYGDLINQ